MSPKSLSGAPWSGGCEASDVLALARALTAFSLEHGLRMLQCITEGVDEFEDLCDAEQKKRSSSKKSLS